jgi:hypothetical protein
MVSNGAAQATRDDANLRVTLIPVAWSTSRYIGTVTNEAAVAALPHQSIKGAVRLIAEIGLLLLLLLLLLELPFEDQ